MPDVAHMMISRMKLTMTLKFVSFSIFERFEGVSPPFNMIFVSAPVKATKPMIHPVLRTVQPRSRSSLMVTGSDLG